MKLQKEKTFFFHFRGWLNSGSAPIPLPFLSHLSPNSRMGARREEDRRQKLGGTLANDNRSKKRVFVLYCPHFFVPLPTNYAEIVRII